MSVDKALASIPPLSDDNWHIWKPLMLSILHLKGIPKLETLDLSRPTHKAQDMDAHACRRKAKAVEDLKEASTKTRHSAFITVPPF